jgi:hypothetical protein
VRPANPEQLERADALAARLDARERALEARRVRLEELAALAHERAEAMVGVLDQERAAGRGYRAALLQLDAALSSYVLAESVALAALARAPGNDAD